MSKLSFKGSVCTMTTGSMKKPTKNDEIGAGKKNTKERDNAYIVKSSKLFKMAASAMKTSTPQVCSKVESGKSKSVPPQVSQKTKAGTTSVKNDEKTIERETSKRNGSDGCALQKIKNDLQQTKEVLKQVLKYMQCTNDAALDPAKFPNLVACSHRLDTMKSIFGQ